MFGIRLIIQPTAGLTFRRLPGSILHIATYPFLPPTTMSGFLRRLAFSLQGSLPEDIESSEDRATCPSFYALPRTLIPVGAYPENENWYIHTTKRQGIRSFNHDAFSRLYRVADKKQNYQLHDWDYLMCERLIGYILSEDRHALGELQKLINRGCKIGKEGYAFLAEVSAPTEFTLQFTIAQPHTVVPGSLLIGIPCDAFPLYRYEWEDNHPDQAMQDLSAKDPSPIKGFSLFIAGMTPEPIQADFFTNGQAFIPKALIDLLL